MICRVAAQKNRNVPMPLAQEDNIVQIFQIILEVGKNK
jgi:hypothetical protein